MIDMIPKAGMKKALYHDELFPLYITRPDTFSNPMSELSNYL